MLAKYHMWPVILFNQGYRFGARSVRGRFVFPVLAIFFCTVFYRTALGSEALPDFDRRYDNVRGPVKLVADRQAAHKALQQRVPEARVMFDPLLGTPASITVQQGALSGPRGEGKAISTEAARAIDRKDPHHAVKAMLQEHRKLFGHGPEVLASARTSRDYVASDDGSRMVYWEQQLDGIPVHLARIGAKISAKGELVSIASTFVPDADGAATAGVPRRKALQRSPDVSARQAVMAAITSVQEEVPAGGLIQTGGPLNEAEQLHYFKAGRLPGVAQASLIWLPMSGDRLRLCWAVEVTRRARGERFRVLVDAENGQVWLRRCLTFDLSEVTYRVYTGESPTPLLTNLVVPSRFQPDPVPRKLVTLSALDTNASPLGWIDDGVNETRGNNVDAYLDRDADDRPDLPRVRGNPNRVFDFPLDLNQSPTNFGPAAVVQLFYWCNWMHDRLFQLGFTPTNGNFQKDKFGIGKGGDPVLAEAQDGGGFNNANFTPAPLGTSPKIQLFIFSGPNPWRDADLDASVILHEYTHGMTDRLVGGGGGINNGYQPYGLAEGWSDFFAQAVLSTPEDDPDGVYACGGYSAYKFNGLQENWYFGIRRYPYTTDTNKNPLCFQHIYVEDVPEFPNIPRNPTVTSSAMEGHRMGEVWCTILWEMRASLMHKWGNERGNDVALRLVRKGLENLTMQNPNFVQARDAIRQADGDLYQGANQAALWEAFAKRGLGYGAATEEIPYISITWTNSFSLPPPLNVDLDYTPVVLIGAAFDPQPSDCILQNLGTKDLDWVLKGSENWLSFSMNGGTLSGQSITNVGVVLNSNVLNLAVGDYTNVIVCSNQTSGDMVTRFVILHVISPATVGNSGMYQERFPLDFFTYSFTPETNTHLYAVCKTP